MMHRDTQSIPASKGESWPLSAIRCSNYYHMESRVQGTPLSVFGLWVAFCQDNIIPDKIYLNSSSTSTTHSPTVDVPVAR